MATPDLNAYAKAQAEWSLEAIGAFKRERIKRDATTDCLHALRDKHIIN